MSKKDAKKGFPPVIKMSCGKEGCSIKEYTMPYAGTKEDFRRHYVEKFKTYQKQAA